MRTHAPGDAAQGVSRGGNQPPLSTSSLHLTSARRTHRRFLASSDSNPSKLPLRSEQAPIPIRASSVSNPSRLRLQSEPAPSSVRAGSDSSPSWLRSDSMLASFRHRSYPSQPLLSSPQPTLRQCFAPLCARFVAKASLFRRKVGTKGRKEILESHQLAQAGCVS